MTGDEFGVTSSASPPRSPARPGFRAAGGGSSGAAERTMIQRSLDFFGRIKFPRKTALGFRAMVSPGCAMLSASCNWPPARTRMRRPTGGSYEVSIVALGGVGSAPGATDMKGPE